ncbi:MAG: GNAT family N-acetyltransferase [Acidimicrobiia bacterium]|nr:GNAT family N-acetyltransferase [Acidimicrobiia bacterium]
MPSIISADPTPAADRRERSDRYARPDGSAVRLRSIRPSDGDELLALGDRCSDQTIYRRFFSPRRALTPDELTRLVTVDHHDREAVVVIIDARIAAVARYDVTHPGTAEIAVLVEDAHQGRGLGTLLVDELVARARANGIERLEAETMADNRAMLAVLQRTGLRSASALTDDGTWIVTLDLVR